MTERHVLAMGGARRLDWHALLPERDGSEPGRWLLLGTAPEVGRLAVELGLAGSAGTAVSDTPADVVAILHGATETLERSIDALAPGGCLYWEIDRRSLRTIGLTPGRARARLKRAGLTSPSIYWVGPGWARPSRFLPIEPAGPFGWYVGSTYAPAGPPSSLRHRLARLIATSPRLTAMLVPRLAIVATRREIPVGARPTAINQPGIPSSVRSSGVPPILLTRGEGPWGRITLLAFADPGSPPSVVVKVSRQAAFDQATRHEHEALVKVRGRVDADTRSTLPEPISLVDVLGRPAVVQSAVSGVAALVRMGRSRRGEGPWQDFELTAGWLVALHVQTVRSRVAPGSTGWSRQVEEPLVRFAGTFGARPAVARLFEAIRGHATTLGAELPVVFNHCDLGPWNVHLDGDRIRVIDWEGARDGPALTDLLYASLHWSFASRRLTSERLRRLQLRRLFVGPDAVEPDRSAIRAAVDRYGEALGLDGRLLPAMVVLTMVQQALDRFDRLERIGATDPDPWTQNRYVGYVEEIASFDDNWLTNPLPAVDRH